MHYLYTYQNRAAESGYVPGIIYVMSKVYKPHEFTRRLALLLCMTAVSSIVSGPIAYGTSFLDGRNGINGWQYLFIVEGAPTIFLGILSFFCLFDDIDQVSWLTDEQKALHKSYTQGPEVHKTVTIKTVFWAIVDWKTVMFSVCYIISSINFISYQVFAPIIIDGMCMYEIGRLMTPPLFFFRLWFPSIDLTIAKCTT